MTAKELSSMIPGRTLEAVRRMRVRLGRFSGPGLCAKCGSRPVWAESRGARRARLCKGCWLEEESLRIAEEAESARIRQARSRLAARVKREAQ